MTSLLFTGARLVNEGKIVEGDLLVRDGRIARIGGDLGGEVADRVIDADGRHLLPGLIDDQVHFREPGLTNKGDIASESAAAVAGGVTSYMEMPNTMPPTTDAEALEAKYAAADGRSRANYAFYLGATNSNLDDIRACDPEAACGVKVFMGSSTGDMLVDDPDVLDRIFAECPVPISTHCEDTPRIRRREEAYRTRYGEDVPARCHAEIRDHQACLLSSSLAVDLARRHGTQLHVLHLTTADELELFAPGPLADKHITAEVCVHHLWFADEDYHRLEHRLKCNPAVKTAADREALRRAVVEDRIDIIATDHAPHTAEEKDRTYFEAPAGLPLVQNTLQLLCEMVHRGVFDLETVVRKACHAPAERFRVAERGYLREGYHADLVLVDTRGPVTIPDAPLRSKCGWTPFEGEELHGRVDCTVVGGEVVYDGGELVGEPTGQRLAFDR